MRTTVDSVNADLDELRPIIEAAQNASRAARSIADIKSATYMNLLQKQAALVALRDQLLKLDPPPPVAAVVADEPSDIPW